MTIQEILNNTIQGVVTHKSTSGPVTIQIIMELAGDNYENIAKTLREAGYVKGENDGRVESWAKPR